MSEEICPYPDENCRYQYFESQEVYCVKPPLAKVCPISRGKKKRDAEEVSEE